MNERLKLLRKYLKLSQAEFGNKIFLTQNHISSLEKGRRVLSDRTIKLICSTFGVDEKWFRTGEGNMFDSLIKDIDGLDDDVKELLEKYALLNEDDKTKLKKILNTFLE